MDYIVKIESANSSSMDPLVYVVYYIALQKANELACSTEPVLSTIYIAAGMGTQVEGLSVNLDLSHTGD